MKRLFFGLDRVPLLSISTELVRINLEKPVALARRTVSCRDFLFVEITDSFGNRGLGFTYAGYENTESVVSATQLLLRSCVGQFFWKSPQDVWDSIYLRNPRVLDHPVFAKALSALDIAFWDLWGHQQRLPLRNLMGAAGASRIETYVGAGYYGTERGKDILIEELTSLVECGYSSIKVKVGRDRLVDERKRALDSRKAVGQQVAITFDANGAFDSVEVAGEFVKAYAEAEPIFIEDALPNRLLRNYKELAGNSQARLTCGEYVHGKSDWDFLLNSACIPLLQLDATSCGGITEMIVIAKAAQEKNLKIDTHWFPELNLRFADCFENLHQVEIFHSNAALPFADIIQPDGELGHGISRRLCGAAAKVIAAERVDLSTSN